MSGLISTEFTDLTADNFENSLASDDLLAQYFNDFLTLPSFPETPLLYNQETGQFEVVDGAAEFVSRRIRSGVHRSRSQLLTGDPAALARTPPVDNHYPICCLDREQGIQWIMKERLPFFLQSDCYNEYRLSKLLFQKNTIFCIQRRKGSSSRPTRSAPQLCFPSQSDEETNKALKGLPCSHSQDNSSAKQGSSGTHNVTCLPSGLKEHINTKGSESSRCFSSCSEPENPCHFCSSSSPSNLECEKLQSPQTEWSLSFTEPSAGNSEEQQESSRQNEYLAAKVVKQVLNNAVYVMDGQSRANMSDCFSKSGDQTNCTSEDRSCDGKVHLRSADEGTERLEGKKEKVQEGKRCSRAEEKTEWFKKNRRVGGGGTEQENILDICCHGSCCRGNIPGLDELKDFLRGTPGEKLLNLWIDVARLNATQSRERKNRYLVLMRRRYLLSSSQSSLNVELLSRLGMTTSPCWTEEKLRSVLPFLTESLLYYWVPRFWTSQWVHEDRDDSPHPELWTEWCVWPQSDTQPHHGSMALCSDTCLPQYPHAVHTRFYSSRSQLLGSRRMKKMLQALSVESCAGLYFTHFCEQSGNQLWENAVNLWTDLQHYHELFYQDGLDPYRVQRETQLFYSTYLSSSARRSIGVSEEIRREVYDQMMPAFEELFDKVEEHTLNILLEPWTLLVSRDKESFQKVCVQEEVRCIDSQEYRELQSLYEESERRLKQVKQSTLFPSPISPSTPFSKGPRAPDSWSRVSPNYQGYRLGSLLRHRQEIGHFMSFLQNRDASIHLTCWLDLEQYRRTPHKDNAVRQEKWSHIATKYLTRTYFFGSDSPATTEQQNDILLLAGGLERLKLECPSYPVVGEIQDVIRSHIEKRWLPLFLSTAEFTERLKHQPKPQAPDRLSQHVYRRRRARREAWKAEGLWMSSSKEILLFRRILLNPATCIQFQHFVSLKGDFLESDVLFWLEVQRYKDLCHSHSDEATVQQKVSTIINCFIDSSMPPALQIDIPPGQAQQVLERRHKLGPYIFREAQMSVFSALLKFWPEFQELSSSVQEGQLLPLLQEKRVKHRARVRRQRRKEEEEESEEEKRRAQKELERPESSLGEEKEDDVEGQEGRSVKKQSRAQSRELLTPTQQLSWSYAKYLAALKREEVLLRRQSQLGASFSTASGTPPLHLSPRAQSNPHVQHFNYSLLPVRLNEGNQNTEMTFSRSHSRRQPLPSVRTVSL
ncbi:regulator of G-protein signaling 22 isoform X3 [Anarrhichthys ocellatus]|uniref:regulator of G-protein signaling 22 isoform X3 n=1 Tax=Anarrhichthys ocellatus TaxID=433405 RepID=UPI0012ED57B5|nr:regulator of G-protein signaling 22 isoform X3 [Anarrhichthys ocellatus]